MMIIDCLQYCNWSEKIFQQMRQGSVDAVHVTIAYHENFRETILNIEQWNRWFLQHPDKIVHGRLVEDIDLAKSNQQTAIFFGLQNCSPMEDDIDLIEILHTLGIRFMQLTYNNQSLLATGCYESKDNGITRMGKQAIKEMNRVGMVIDMSHSAEKSTLEAIEFSQRPIAITHANPLSWSNGLRNKSDKVLKALSESEGMLGFSLYPHHLRNKSQCTLQEFCQMIAQTVELMGIDRLGIGSDLCQDHPDSVVEWMRVGRWTKEIDYGEGSSSQPGFPEPLGWFANNSHIVNIQKGLKEVGFNQQEVAQLMGENWYRFFSESFTPYY